MNRFFKSAAFVALVAVALTSCDDQANVGTKDGKGSAAATIHLGLPGGTDPVDANGNVTVSRNVSLVSGNTYVLHNYFRIQSGFTITIDPGVEIRGVKRNTTADDLAPGTLIIERGAQIDADASCESPIVFTSNATTKAPGDWGGVVLLGFAPANIAGTRGTTPSGTDGVGVLEGLRNNDNGLYGGSNAADNSGTLRYVRIEYAGDVLSPGNELNSLTLGAVGSGTTIDYVEAYKGADDGFEFFGGTVNATHLVAALNADDDIDTDQGFAGNLQFGLIVRHPNATYLADLPLNGGESNGDNDDDYLTQLTNAKLSNFTIVGPYQNDCSITTFDQDYRAGVYFRDLSAQDIFNSVIIGFPNGLRVTSEGGSGAATQFNTGSSLSTTQFDVRNTTIVVPFQSAITGVTTAATWDEATSTTFDAAFNTAILNNSILTAGECIFDDVTEEQTMAELLFFNENTAWSGISCQIPDLRPLAGSPLLGSASFSLIPNFQSVTYRGAFAQNTVSGSDWISCWTKWCD